MSKLKKKLRYPDRKISETFLHFAEPLLDMLGPDPSDTQMEEPLKIAFAVWNAVVFADVVNNSSFLEAIHHSAAQEPELAVFANHLIERKRSLFGNDHRLIGEYKVFRKNGEICLRAEARDPRCTNGWSEVHGEKEKQ